MNRKAFALVLCICVLGLVVAGCGDDDSGSSGGTGGTETTADAASGDDGGGGDGGAASDPEAAAFYEDANELCERSRGLMQAKAQKIFKQSASNSSTENLAADLVDEAIIPGMEEEIEGLQDLDVPDGAEEDFEAVIAVLEEIIEEGEADPKGYSLSNPYAETAERTAEHGLDQCGTPNNPPASNESQGSGNSAQSEDGSQGSGGGSQ